VFDITGGSRLWSFRRHFCGETGLIILAQADHSWQDLDNLVDSDAPFSPIHANKSAYLQRTGRRLYMRSSLDTSHLALQPPVKK
jgi:hypothetical protein